MQKYFLFIIISVICLFSTVDAAVLNNIRYNSYPEKTRIVFDLKGQAYYSVVTNEGSVMIALISCEASQNVKDKLKINDWVLGDIEITRSDNNIFVNIPMNYPVSSSIFPLGVPSRLVIDLGRVFTRTENGGAITDAIKYYRIVKSQDGEYISAQVLKVDPKKADVFPALAQPKNSLLGSFVDFLTPWNKKERKHFYRQRVSGIVADAGAAAGINGTYFSETGRPLGVLMINGEAVSCPISDRTALILTEDGNSYIDNVIMDSYFEYNGKKFEITGVNEPRESKDDIIMYTKNYGALTETDITGYELTVVDQKVTEMRIGNSRIPEKGYVLSIGSLYAEYLQSTIKVGDNIKTVVNLIPYSSDISGKVKHLVGGGPRLLKGGIIYISKYEEKFRRDIAKGRAARSAVGITPDGSLMFVTVDGRPRRKIKKGEGFSLGMTLTELAYFLQSQGAVDALNLDGGGSATMVINGVVVNRPCNNAEISVSNAIVINPRNTF